MPLEVATYINQLDAANPTATDPKSQGDDHLRLLKAVLQANFPNLTGAVTPTQAQLNYLAGAIGNIQTGGDMRNLLDNATGAINQRVYGSGSATVGANQVTLDRWKVIVTGQSLIFPAATPDRVMTAPIGGVEQLIRGRRIVGGVYTLSWTGTATATVNGVAIVNGAQTASLPANTDVTVRFFNGTFSLPQFEAGSVVTPFQRKPPSIEADLCFMEAAKSYSAAVALGANTQAGRYWFGTNLAGSIFGTIYFPVPMSVAPTLFALYDQNGNIGSTLSISSTGAGTTRSATISLVTEKTIEIVGAASSDIAIVGHWFAATGQ